MRFDPWREDLPMHSRIRRLDRLISEGEARIDERMARIALAEGHGLDMSEARKTLDLIRSIVANHRWTRNMLAGFEEQLQSVHGGLRPASAAE